MRTLLIALICLFTSGCAYYLTARPPVMERKLGRPGSESVGALATASDYRLVYVQIDPKSRVCAEPPPDAAGQFASIFAAALSGPKKKQTFDVNTQASLAVSMKQLFKRSQGVQFYRDATFTLCNLYMNHAISEERYFAELQALRTSAAALIDKEIPYLEKISIDPIAPPALSIPEAPGNAKQTTQPAEQSATEPAEDGAETPATGAEETPSNP